MDPTYIRCSSGPLCIAMACLALAMRSEAQTPIYSLYAGGPAQGFGTSIASLGDVDQDGYSDLAIALPTPERVEIYSGWTGTLLHYELVGNYWEIEVGGAGDVNGDGFGDLLVGQPTAGGPGQAWVISGKTWDSFYSVKGTPSLGKWFGSALEGIGDVDQDGNEDFIVGDYGEDLVVAHQGSVRVYSGITGAKLATVFGAPMLAQRFGYSVNKTGDIDGDGIPDWVGGTDVFSGGTTGYVRVYSGADASLIHEFIGPGTTWKYGNSVAGPGDVDSDGVPDVVLGDWWNDAAGPNHGAAHLYSGSTGELLLSVYGDGDNHYFGYHVAETGDLDLDGAAEFMVTALPIATAPVGMGPDYVRVFSGSQGETLYTLYSGYPYSNDGFGYDTAAPGDVNGDAVPDLAVAAPSYPVVGSSGGMVRMFSGSELSLSSDAHTFSISAPGTVNLRLKAGPPHAGSLYLLAGTLSGTTRGIPIDSVVVPLNVDAYLLHTVANPNQPPLASSLGFLGDSGNSLAQFSLPGGLYPWLVGKTAHHAYALLEPAGVTFASNAVPLTFSP